MLAQGLRRLRGDDMRSMDRFMSDNARLNMPRLDTLKFLQEQRKQWELDIVAEAIPLDASLPLELPK